MSVTEKSRVYTVPDSLLPYGLGSEKVFHKVVGVQVGGKDTQWASQRHHGPYESQDIKERELPLDERMWDYLDSFFGRFMTDQRKAGDQYNCHSFAFGLERGELSIREAEALAMRIVQGGLTASTNLSLGQIGVYGGQRQFSNRLIVDHSVVGLGEENDECLQVTSMAGELVVADYGSVERLFKGVETGQRKQRNVRDYGLHVAA